MVVAQMAREYATRPADERFPSVEALVTAAQDERTHSAERDYNLKDLAVVKDDADSVVLRSAKGVARFTHWAFGQFCRMVGAPASYLRELPGHLAADCLNHGLAVSLAGQTASLLVKVPNGTPTPIVRAATSDSYARMWDAELYSAVAQQIVGGHDDRWTLPPTWSGEPAGAYRGDRDSFLILVNGGSIVTDPSLPSDAKTNGPTDGMFRGILIRNSEVGASSVYIDTILYRYICGNHMLWGAVMDTQFRRRHTGASLAHDVVREIARVAYNYTHQAASRDEAIVWTLIDRELAHTKEAVIDELRKIGATKEQAEAAYLACERHESVSPRSYWGAAQGLTRISQDMGGYQDERFGLDMLAAKVLARGRKLVAA